MDAIFSVDPAKRLLIEVKENNVECAAALLEFVRTNELLERSMISSFHLDVLAFLRKAEPAAKLHGNDVTPNGVPEEVAGLIDSIGIQSKFATPERIRHYKAKGIKVDSWVINDRNALVRAIENGTESVTTDVPDLVCRWLGRSSLPDQ
ncbi:hypothetical protein SDC9_144248 [bioreactor metagenome]|uniref:GP-PDE domain-containing protein n=1 Tax=bioreactor metagenome TaxID=1076179 RepID=A0A645E6E2_9ZZZZ